MGSNFNSINFGDKVYIRLQLNGKTIAETMLTNLSSMSELFIRLRSLTREFSGLATLYIRNISRGWTTKRPLMLYPARRQQLTIFNSQYNFN